ncbi:MAG: M16 family metallopeptidase [Solirubrobacterales bacterium]
MFNYNDLVLPNGIKLITIKKDTGIASVHMGFKIGSLYEEQNEKGISHFIEHMLFKGTALRNNEKLNSDLENLGGEYNAYTDHNCTVYSATALSSEIENMINIMSDMVQNSAFPEKEMIKEKEVILSEIRTSRDDLEQYSFKQINEAAYENSPLKYETIGSEKTVKGFSRKQLIDFYEKNYVPNNCYISIVSPYEHDYIKELVWEQFKKWEHIERKEKNVIIEKNIPRTKITYKKNIEQSTIIYLFTFHSITKQEELALKVLNHKFGESSNSILFRELREDKGLAYDVYTHLDLTSMVKTLYIYTAVAEENIDEAIASIDGCIEKIKSQEIVFDESTINLMKKVLNTAVAFTVEDSTDIGNYVIHQKMENEYIFQFIKDMEQLESIKKEDIYNIARNIFNGPTIHILKNEN